jgi:hypothetical protein
MRLNASFPIFCCFPRKTKENVGFEVVTGVVTKRDITPCNLLKVNRHFGGTYRLHLHVRIIGNGRNQYGADIFDPEDGGDMYFRNVSRLSKGLQGIISQKTNLKI